MEITAKMVQDLREQTGAGMMDCKKALTSCEGNLEKALVFLREKGLASASKRAGRTTNQGLVTFALSADVRQGALVEVNCETDFVARTDGYRAFAQSLADHILTEKPCCVDSETCTCKGPALLTQAFATDRSTTIGDALKSVSSKTGENMSISGFRRIEIPADKAGKIFIYIHPGSQVGVILGVTVQNAELLTNPEFEMVYKDCCMHTAALNPRYLDGTCVPEAIVTQEKEIYRAQVAAEGKPEKIVESIVSGKLKKFFSEVTLLDQPFVKDDKRSVGQYIADAAKPWGEVPLIIGFSRFKIGEKA